MDGGAVELGRNDAAWREKDLVFPTVYLGMADAHPGVEGPKGAAPTSTQEQPIRSDSFPASVKALEPAVQRHSTSNSSLGNVVTIAHPTP